ncbi:MAG: non-ribosomal peptide synthetase, partial [Merismopedia sp. SIO2A8]|nr:non-ribosomal peptide synthetase [Merismopedia sp. SIO2A8]
MNPPQPKDSSVLEDKLSDNSQSNNPAKTIPTTGSKSETASAELWESIKTIIGLQNQAPPLVTVSKEGNLPLSFPQERLWFLEQLESANSSYNIPFTFRLKGVLNISALEQSLNEILRRHQALRTNFSSVEGKPVQVIASTVNLTLSVVDLQDLPTQERENKAMQLATESAQQPFELTKEPLFRANLLKLTEQEHILLLNIHHIVFDGWSEGVLFKELAT